MVYTLNEFISEIYMVNFLSFFAFNQQAPKKGPTDEKQNALKVKQMQNVTNKLIEWIYLWYWKGFINCTKCSVGSIYYWLGCDVT